MHAADARVTFVRTVRAAMLTGSIDSLMCSLKGDEMSRLKPGYIYLKDESFLDVKVTYNQCFNNF